MLWTLPYHTILYYIVLCFINSVNMAWFGHNLVTVPLYNTSLYYFVLCYAVLTLLMCQVLLKGDKLGDEREKDASMEVDKDLSSHRCAGPFATWIDSVLKFIVSHFKISCLSSVCKSKTTTNGHFLCKSHTFPSQNKQTNSPFHMQFWHFSGIR